MVLFTMLACAGPDAPIANPAAGQRVARVALFAGNPVVQRSTTEIPVTDGMMLLTSDTVDTSNGMVVVHLPNDHLVRIDEDLALVVGDLVLWQATQSTVSVKDQLAELLDPDEQAAMDPGGDRSERVAGWQLRMLTATRGSGVAVDEDAGSEEMRDAEDDGAGAPDDAGGSWFPQLATRNESAPAASAPAVSAPAKTADAPSPPPPSPPAPPPPSRTSRMRPPPAARPSRDLAPREEAKGSKRGAPVVESEPPPPPPMEEPATEKATFPLDAG
ncbi:MAG: hypothetical protein KC656_18800, partial [Myxococcales bacterium]|nr:hypothetical protein [Myxococcales bacterium]